MFFSSPFNFFHSSSGPNLISQQTNLTSPQFQTPIRDATDSLQQLSNDSIQYTCIVNSRLFATLPSTRHDEVRTIITLGYVYDGKTEQKYGFAISWTSIWGTWDSCTSSGVFASTKCVLRHSRPQGAVRYISMAPMKKFLGLECSTSKQYPNIHVLGVANMHVAALVDYLTSRMLLDLYFTVLALFRLDQYKKLFSRVNADQPQDSLFLYFSIYHSVFILVGQLWQLLQTSLLLDSNHPLNPLDSLNVAISTVIALTVIGALVNFTIGCNCSNFLCLDFTGFVIVLLWWDIQWCQS
jgi:hypothetical protein